MSLKNNEFLLKNFKVLAVTLLVLVGLIGVSWWKHEQSQQEIKLQLEREQDIKRIGMAFRQAGIAAAKTQQAQIKPRLQEDELAPHELSDEGELAQAKLWLSLPKDKREIMRTDTINAGLAAAKKEQPAP